MIEVVSSNRRRDFRFIVLAWLCSWIRGGVVESQLFGGFLSGRCRLQLSDSCGFLQLGSLIRYGEPETTDCREECRYLLITADRGYACGSCTISPTEAPITTVEQSTFDIYLDLDVPIEDRALIRRASNRWTNIIRSELSDVDESELVGSTELEGNCEYPSTIDDIYMCFQYIEIDGAGGVLGRTTILATRTDDDDDGSDGMPISARIRFDSDDVDSLKSQGLFQDVVEHEIVHGLGFGILWGSKGLIETQTDGTCEYVGPKATLEFEDASGGCLEIPNTCGHWDEDCLGRELMTDTFDGAISNLVSRVTVASMEDLGYDVDYSFADEFSQVEISIFCRVNCPNRKLLEDDNATSNLHHPIDISTTTNTRQQRRRKLSDEGYANAVHHGREVLEQETSQSTKQPKNRTVYILYMEEDTIYSVPVHHE